MDLDELIAKLQEVKQKYPTGDFSVFLAVPGNGPCIVKGVSTAMDDFEDARIHARCSGRPQVIVYIDAEE